MQKSGCVHSYAFLKTESVPAPPRFSLRRVSLITAHPSATRAVACFR